MDIFTMVYWCNHVGIEFFFKDIFYYFMSFKEKEKVNVIENLKLTFDVVLSVQIYT